jgi:hypothetical protein
MPKGVRVPSVKILALTHDILSRRFTAKDLMRRHRLESWTVYYHAAQLGVKLRLAPKRRSELFSSPVAWDPDADDRQRREAGNRGDPEVCSRFGMLYVVHNGQEVYRAVR